MLSSPVSGLRPGSAAPRSARKGKGAAPNTASKPRAKALPLATRPPSLDFLSMLEDAERRDTARLEGADDRAARSSRRSAPAPTATPLSQRGARGTPRPSPLPRTPRAPRAQHTMPTPLSQSLLAGQVTPFSLAGAAAR